MVPGYLDNLRAAREAGAPVGASIVDIAEEHDIEDMARIVPEKLYKFREPWMICFQTAQLMRL